MTRVFAIPEFETPRMARPPAPTHAERFAAGDEGAFAEAVRTHGPGLVRLARRLLGWRTDAEDVVQETFVRAYLKRTTFRADARIATWLGRMVINRCREVERRRRLWPQMLQGWLERRATPDRAGDELTERVREAVRKLPMPEREAVVLYYLGEHAAAEVCELLAISESALNTRLHRARKKLGAALESTGGRPS